MTKKRTTKTKINKETYGDQNFRGNGKLLCYLCSTPVRDHPLAVGSCPFPPNPVPVDQQRSGRGTT